MMRVPCCALVLTLLLAGGAGAQRGGFATPPQASRPTPPSPVSSPPSRSSTPAPRAPVRQPTQARQPSGRPAGRGPVRPTTPGPASVPRPSYGAPGFVPSPAAPGGARSPGVQPSSPSLDSVARSPEAKAAALAAASKFRALRVSGKDTRKAVTKVRKLHWHKSLAAAKQQAVKEGKPILFIQALGDLGGFT